MPYLIGIKLRADLKLISNKTHIFNELNFPLVKFM